MAPSIGEQNKGAIKIHDGSQPSRAIEFNNRIHPAADIDQEACLSHLAVNGQGRLRRERQY
jgi:hypothetical protein